MEESTHKPSLRDEFSEEQLTGVQYDRETGDFVRLSLVDGILEIRSPDGEDVWETLDDVDDVDASDFTSVPDKAQDKPATYAQRRLEELGSGTYDQASRPAESEAIGVLYVLQAIEIVPTGEA